MPALRIGLNFLPFQPEVGGTWHYAARLLAALAAHEPANEYIVFVTDASESMVPAAGNCTRVHVAIDPVSRARRVAFENARLPSLLQAARVDCVHHFFGTLPFFSSPPCVVTIHDLLAFERPQTFAWHKRVYLRAMMRRSMRQATLLAPVSRSTADHIAHLFDVGTDRMHVVPAAVADTFVKRDAHAIDAFRLRHELPEHFWLLVTAPYAHKNHRVLLDAFATLRERHPDGWPLVIRGTLTEDALAFAGARSLGKHVRLLPRVTDDEMPLLYSAASALVFPSLFEGGGMPLMEALACGCPAVASDIPTTREFAGGAAITFDPASAGELGAAMQRVERAPELRARLATLGPVAVERLRPAAVAAACTEAYRRAVALTR